MHSNLKYLSARAGKMPLPWLTYANPMSLWRVFSFIRANFLGPHSSKAVWRWLQFCFFCLLEIGDNLIFALWGTLLLRLHDPSWFSVLCQRSSFIWPSALCWEIWVTSLSKPLALDKSHCVPEPFWKGKQSNLNGIFVKYQFVEVLGAFSVNKAGHLLGEKRLKALLYGLCYLLLVFCWEEVRI